jgi:hypothetical protein
LRSLGLLTRAVVTTGDAPSRESSLLVFSQAAGADIDVDAWNAQAVRFFDCRIGLAESSPSPSVALVVAPNGEAPGIRRLRARPRDAEDLRTAEAADPGASGLALLAKRCHLVWMVERDDDDDRLALRLAIILASLFLGPVLDTRGPHLFGVKTGRAKLEIRSDR